MYSEKSGQKYMVTEKIYNSIKVSEFKPILTEEEEKEHNETITEICVRILLEYQRI